ncbi:MAG: beta-hexosaminidase [Firmicutes bacterium]|nr:beta-hexosaminidase [Bacillota bacterium]
MRKYIALFFMSAMIILTMAGCQTTPDTAASSGEQAQATGQASEEAATAEDQTTDAGSSQEEAEAAAESSEEEPTEEVELFGYGLFGGDPYVGSGLAEITPEQEAAIRAMIAEMSVEEKVGQMFLARFPGAKEDGPESSAAAEEDVRTYHLGGFVLFRPDFKVDSETKIIEKLDAVQAASAIPLLLSVDEEGGDVVRVSTYFRNVPFTAPRNAYDWFGSETVISEIYERCELLGSLHLNMNLYPVCDLSGDVSDFIYYRAFSGDPDTAADYIAKVVSTMKDYHMACSLKHFPGYGNNKDTHTDLVVDERPAETFYEADFKPFMAGIAQGAETVMVSHNIVNCFDPENPASISPEVHRILREELGFEGVILTDDLGMEGVKKYSDEDVAVMAVLAGNDMLVSSDYQLQYEAVLAAVLDGRISEERLDESVYRILRMKVSMGILVVE